MPKTDIISVSQYLDKLNFVLKSEKAKVIGEVFGVQEYPGRSYLYFSIKDSRDGSSMKCFMWKNDYKISGVTLRDGLEVIVTSYPAIYKQNGGLSLQVELVEMVGEGALQIAYEKLKEKLALEGMFLDVRKRELPMFPQKIGVITSKNGAVIHDFLTNIGKFGYEILFVDSRVEGQDATKDLILAMKTLKDKKLDVLVIMRGGGSLESFQAFNNEMLVRAVAEFPAPVLTGIGHDKDVPLVSMVSDANVSTPTAVASLLNYSWSTALTDVNMSEQKIISSFSTSLKDVGFSIQNSVTTIHSRFESLLQVFKKAEQTLLFSIDKIGSEISGIKELLKQSAKEINRGFGLIKNNIDEILRQSLRSINMASPINQLARGYSIVRLHGKVIRYLKDVKVGDRLGVQVSDGIINTITIK